MFEKKAELQRIADGVLSRLKIDGKAVFHYLSENATYIIYIEEKPIYTLRISRIGYHTYEELQGEIKWLKSITKVPVKKPISDIIEYDGYYCVLFEYIDGEAEPEPYTTEAMFYKLGQLTAILHTQNNYKLCRPNWSYELMVGVNGIWGDWRLNSRLSTEQKSLIQSALDLCKQAISEYHTDKYGLIHTDIRQSNIILCKDRLVITDFDDCGYGFYMQELAGSMSFCENLPQADKLKSAWLNGYSDISEISEADRAMADYFIFLRKIQLLAWITGHNSSDYVQNLPSGFEKECVALADELIKKQN